MKINNFNELHIQGNCNFQFIRVNKGTQVSVNVPFEIEEFVKIKQNNNIVSIHVDVPKPESWITIRYQRIDQIIAEDYAKLKAEHMFNFKKIELYNNAKFDINYLFSTQSRSYIKLIEDCQFNVHSFACLSKDTNFVVEAFDSSNIFIQEGKGDRLECFLYDMSKAQLGNIIFDSIQLNQNSWAKESVFCAYNSLTYLLKTSNDLNLSAKVKKLVKLSSLDFNYINEGDKDISNYAPLSAEEMFERFKLFNSEDFMQFLLNPYCTEMIDSSNRTWVIESAKKITLEDFNKLNPEQQKSYDSIMFVYNLDKVPFSF